MSSRRRDQDLMKLMMSDFAVTLSDDSGNEFLVDFAGPADTLYAGGVWKVQVTLPKDYPYRSPSIGFKTRMFHPNVDEMSGSVCLDVINQTWTPMYDLVNIFEVFLPQLLSYPNASDPLNSEAASLLLRSPQAYKEKVLEYVKKYASLTPNSPPTSTSSTSTFSSHSSGASTTTCSTVDERRSSGESFVTWDGSEREDSMQQDGEEDDEQDELSSLSDSSDTEDKLVLDL